MKKRIALATAIALAISVGGMLPASATKLTAPVVAADYCNRAGGTLEIRDLDDDLKIGRTDTYLTVDAVNDAGTASDTTACVASSAALALTGLTSVVIKVDGVGANLGDVRFDLENPAGGIYEGRLANYAGITFTVQADGDLEFLGGDIDFAISGTVTEEDFSVGSLHGAYYAGEQVEFVGGTVNDSFDASAVVTTGVVATGGTGNDTLKGGAEDDTLSAGDGIDKLYGNGGDDTITIDGDVTDDDADQAWGGTGDDGITLQDGLTHTTAHPVVDVVAPGDGSDSISVGDVKVITYVDSSVGITLNLDTDAGVVRSSAGDDYYAEAPLVFAGSSFADSMTGDDGAADVFMGGAGSDTLVGLAGDDSLSGGGGKDVIKGGEGLDELSGDTGADTISGGSDADTINGGGGDDVLYGSNGDDVLRGDKGSDQAWGGKGRLDVCAAEVTDSCEFKK